MKEIQKKLGLIHIYTGNGKGKTTAALGLAMRALEHGLSVSMIQFLKGGSYIGELLAPERFPNFSIEQYGKGNEKEPEYTDFNPDEKDRKRALKGLKRAEELIKEGKTDILILDEITIALQLQHLSLKEIHAIIENKPIHMELILTGRNAPKELMKKADYVTEMKATKHPFDRGILGRKGIDY